MILGTLQAMILGSLQGRSSGFTEADLSPSHSAGAQGPGLLRSPGGPLMDGAQYSFSFQVLTSCTGIGNETLGTAD